MEAAREAEARLRERLSSSRFQGCPSDCDDRDGQGSKLALEQHDGKAGDIEAKYTSLDDSTTQAGNWDAGGEQANAQKVAQDDSAVGLHRRVRTPARARSIPVLNEVPVAQISPSNTVWG